MLTRFKGIMTYKHQLDKIPIMSGQMILCPDSNELFVDNGSDRDQITDFVWLESDIERINVKEPIPNKIYIIKENFNLWTYDDGKWVNLTDSETIKNTIKELVEVKANKTSALKITLLKNSWLNNLQIVEAKGMTPISAISVGPTPSSDEMYGDCGILCIEQATDKLIFECKQIPTENLDVNVYIFDAVTEYSGGSSSGIDYSLTVSTSTETPEFEKVYSLSQLGKVVGTIEIPKNLIKSVDEKSGLTVVNGDLSLNTDVIKDLIKVDSSNIEVTNRDGETTTLDKSLAEIYDTLTWQGFI